MGEELGWDSINVDEGVSKEDLKNSEDISKKHLIGKFLCKVVGVNPVQKDFKAYSCYAANLKMEIDSVIEIEQPILNDDNTQAFHPKTKRPLMRKTAIPDGDESFNTTIAGQFIYDDVNLYNPKEKEGTKNRRLFVARKIGIIGDNATALTAADWQNCEGRMVIVETEWNRYTPAGSTEEKENSKVMWEGYESASVDEVEPDFSGI